MNQDTEVVPRIQGSPSLPHHKRAGTNLNPVGGLIQAATTGGRATTNPGTTGKYYGQASRRREDCGSSAKVPYGTVGGTIGHKVITPEDMATGGNQGEISRHREVV